MRLTSLPLAAPIADHLRERGIEELYPPQAAAVEAGVCTGDNVVAAMPTASGKTLVAQLALLTAGGPGLYVCPLRALAREKYETFASLPGVDVGISTGDFDATAEELAGHDIVVATAEKVDSAIRNGATWVDDLACVVVDEVHLLDADRRGPTLEVTLATLRRRNPDIQVVALSAPVDNPEAIADWLDATLVESDWRPVSLRTGVCVGDRVSFDDGTETAVDVSDPPARADAPDETGSVDDDPTPNADETVDETTITAALVAETVTAGGQCLAFVRSRAEAARLAEQLAADDLAKQMGIEKAASSAADAVSDVDGTVTGRTLAGCVRSGVAFHHAGLRSGHRAAVERAFRDRKIACLCATPTLAAGVNVPARRVVVRDQRRYTGSSMEWLPTLEVHQMCGRAGRPDSTRTGRRSSSERRRAVTHSSTGTLRAIPRP